MCDQETPSRPIDFDAQVLLDRPLFLVLDGDESPEVHFLKLLEDLGDTGDAFPEQHVDFISGSLDVFQVDHFQAGGEPADGRSRVVSTGGELSCVRGGAHGR